MRVDCAGDAICNFDVKFRDNIFWVDASLANITDGCALDHVPHSETFNSLVLGDAARAVGTAEVANVTAAMLAAAGISSLLSLLRM